MSDQINKDSNGVIKTPTTGMGVVETIATVAIIAICHVDDNHHHHVRLSTYDLEALLIIIIIIIIIITIIIIIIITIIIHIFRRCWYHQPKTHNKAVTRQS